MEVFEQKSFQDDFSGKGKLYLVPTPIGNLDDMTYRAVKILKEVDLICAEDTRHTKKLCHVFEIETPLISYHEHNKKEREEEIVRRMEEGQSIALVSDAGMPAISDPGQEIVSRLLLEGITVVPLPGANAALTGLVASGLSTNSFTFVGFLNRQKKKRKEELEKWQYTPSTLIFYEAPHRIKEMMKAIVEAWGNERKVVVCRELTKRYETFIRGSAEEVLQFIEKEGIKGECVVLVEGAEEGAKPLDTEWWEDLTVTQHVDQLIARGLSSKDAIKEVAVTRKRAKREIYQEYHVEE